MYSYYDILTLMKYNKHPKKILVHYKDEAVHYEYNTEFQCYILVHDELFNEEAFSTWDSYLSNFFYENMMFDKCIDVICE